MKRSMFVLLCLWMLLSLGGCGSLLYREYGQVQPHSSTYYESGDRSVLRAESYQDVVNDLLLLISDHEESGSIWFYPGEEGPDTAQIAQEACKEVQMETPLGSYAVEYITYIIDSSARNYVEISVTIGYRRTAGQVDGIVHATSVSALYDLLNAAASSGASELVVQLSYFEPEQREELQAIVARVQQERQESVQEPWEVFFYPDSGDAEIVEIILEKAGEQA